MDETEGEDSSFAPFLSLEKHIISLFASENNLILLQNHLASSYIFTNYDVMAAQGFML